MVTRDKDNIPYTLQNWYEGRECDTKSREDIIRSVQILARVHKFMNMPVEKATWRVPLQMSMQGIIRKSARSVIYPPERLPVARFEKNFWAVYSGFWKKGKKHWKCL